jgi:hypothetical protein
MQRADFIETGCYDTVVKQVQARKSRDDANRNTNINNINNVNVLEFESKSVNTIVPAVVR